MADELDLTRRRFLTAATAVTGAVGVVAGATPFIASMKPSARARALGAPVQVDISDLAEGEMMKVKWRGKPVVVLRRNAEMIDELTQSAAPLRDPNSEEAQQPNYATNANRSIRPDVFVALSICTHLGCAPAFRPQKGEVEIGADWPGGFFCRCHGSKFDLAGRVYTGVPAPLNLQVPPYRFLDENTLLIGDDLGVVA
ncbi:MAG: ubiquinol-cytochrome c reductase iron-sulfur subunit [Gammaproteobacteria bacterium]|nr:ubiquinol-cytochrome c reductase iron-sulfur subunit [Gammaproteobacteria bacterium]